MSVEPEQTQPKPKRRRRQILVIILVLGLSLLIGGYWLGRIWLVRSRTLAAFEGMGLHVTQLQVTDVTPWHAEIRELVAGPPGALTIQRISIDYTIERLFHRSVDRISIAGADAGLPLLEALKARPKTTEGTQPAPLPFSTIELANCNVHLGKAGDEIVVPISGTVTHDSGRLQISAKANLNPKPLIVSAVVNGQDIAGSIDCEALDTPVVQKIMRDLNIATPDISGWVGARVAVAMQGGQGSITATLRPQAVTIASEKGDKLNLEKGVITLEQPIGSASQVGVVTINGLNASSSTYDVWMEGISGSVTIQKPWPLVTPPDQRLTIAKLTSGKVKLTNGAITFNGQADGDLIIQETHWQGMGGLISSENAKFSQADSSIAATIKAQDVALHDLLDAFGQGKATGDGRVNATIPLNIRNGRLALGEGSVIATPGGNLQILESKTITNTIAAGDPRFAAGGQYSALREDLPKALSDFEFQVLRADLRNSDNGIRADVHLAGRGRNMKTQPYDLELRISPINQALAIGLGLQQLLEGK